MSDDPVDAMAAFWTTLGHRTQQYLDVWSTAATKNASGDYSADELMVDLERIWGMAIADATLHGAAWLEQASALIPDLPDPNAPADQDPTPAGPTDEEPGG